MSVIEDMPLSLPTGSELAGSENGGSSEHRAVRSNRSFELPALNQDRTKFSSEPSHSMGDLPPIELERADFAAFSHGDLPPIDQLGFDAADLATQSLPVDLMSMKSFKKPALQLRRSHFSKKDLVLDRLETCTASEPCRAAMDLLFSTFPDPESSRHHY
mmetsp:Transcript_4903/g.11231  ORF Transcript_4903/g.11231 Transcript_4903/m.11231 type:complete len:159 (-) Transcript_4903:388-864(-)